MQCRSEECVVLKLYSSIRLYGVVLNSVQEQFYIYFSVVLPQAKSFSKLFKPKVTTSVTVPRKWKNFRICLQRSATAFKMFSPKVTDAHRVLKDTKNFRLRDNEPH
jgi:hypothetical protein